LSHISILFLKQANKFVHLAIDLGLELFHLAVDLSNLTNLVLELFIHLTLDFLNRVMGLQIVPGDVVFQIFDSLSNDRHDTFPLSFLVIVDRSDDVEVLLLCELVERTSESNPIHVADVHLRFSFDSVEHAFFHNSGECITKNSDQSVEHYNLRDQGGKQEHNPHRYLNGL